MDSNLIATEHSSSELENSVNNVSTCPSSVEHIENNSCDHYSDPSGTNTETNSIVDSIGTHMNNCSQGFKNVNKSIKAIEKKRKPELNTLSNNDISGLNKLALGGITSGHSHLEQLHQPPIASSMIYSTASHHLQSKAQTSLNTATPHNSIDSTIGPSSVQEISARLLFMAIKWCKAMPSFAALPLRDQVRFFETKSYYVY